MEFDDVAPTSPCPDLGFRNRALRAGSPQEPITVRSRPETLLERAVAFAVREGFDFSAQELRAYLKAKASAQGETVTYDYIDQGLVDGVVNGAGAATEGTGEALKPVQSGKVSLYAALLFGAAAIGALILVIVV